MLETSDNDPRGDADPFCKGLKFFVGFIPALKKEAEFISRDEPVAGKGIGLFFLLSAKVVALDKYFFSAVL